MKLFKTKLKYAFILGHEPKLSVKEIESVLAAKKVDFERLVYSNQVLLIEVSEQLVALELQQRLGGTIKIAKISKAVQRPNLEPEILGLIRHKLDYLHWDKASRFQYGFSYYGSTQLKILEKIGLTLKKVLKAQGLKVRFVTSKEADLSSVIVDKERLIDRGIDLVIVQDREKFYLGYTLAVQDFRDYSKRDYGRPFRDDKSGMLPPKLAKLMINLAQADHQQPILDPFCGSGTVLQEALLLGYQKIIGSDISAKAIADTQRNLTWLKTKYRLTDVKIQVHQLAADQLYPKIPLASVEAIITEPYLGPAEKIAPNQLSGVIYQLTKLYLQAFSEFKKVLNAGGRVVIILPIIAGQTLNILEDIKKLGFSLEPLAEHYRGSITYERQSQRVKREIFIFKKL